MAFGKGAPGSMFAGVDLDNRRSLHLILDIYHAINNASAEVAPAQVLQRYRDNAVSEEELGAAYHLFKAMGSGPNARVAFFAEAGALLDLDISQVAFLANATNAEMQAMVEAGSTSVNRSAQKQPRKASRKGDDDEDEYENADEDALEDDSDDDDDGFDFGKQPKLNPWGNEKHHPTAGKPELGLYPGQDKSRAELGKPNPQKFAMFFSSKKAGTTTETWRLYPKWTLFNWRSRNQLDALNKWRSQVKRRAGEEKRAPRLYWTLLERLVLEVAIADQQTLLRQGESINWREVADTFNAEMHGKVLKKGRALARTINGRQPKDASGRFTLSGKVKVKTDYVAQPRTWGSLKTQAQRLPATLRVLNLDGGRVDSDYEGDHDDDDYDSSAASNDDDDNDDDVDADGDSKVGGAGEDDVVAPEDDGAEDEDEEMMD